MTALEAIETVLTEAGKHLDCMAITEQILERQLWKTNAQIPSQSIHAYLSVDIKNKGKESKFQRTAPGTFALRSWGLPEVASRASKQVAPPKDSQVDMPSGSLSFADAAEVILSQSTDHEPMHYKAITEKALELDLVQSSGQTPAATLNAVISLAIAQATKRGETPKFTRPGRAEIRNMKPALRESRKHPVKSSTRSAGRNPMNSSNSVEAMARQMII